MEDQGQEARDSFGPSNNLHLHKAWNIHRLREDLGTWHCGPPFTLTVIVLSDCLVVFLFCRVHGFSALDTRHLVS